MKALLPSLLFVLVAPWGHAGDRSPAPHYQAPSRTPAPLVPEKQTDTFSCGFHALSAIYRSYGLDPRRARLRARLGTSVPAVPFVSDSTGTLQPDLFRVLQQDGFLTEVVHPRRPEDRRRLLSHLEDGQYALALVRTERAGGLHWVVFAAHRDGMVTVGDSLRAGLREAKLSAFTDGPLLSCILLTPGNLAPGSPYHGAHVRGLGTLLSTAWQSAPVPVAITLLALLACCAWLARRTCRRIARSRAR